MEWIALWVLITCALQSTLSYRMAGTDRVDMIVVVLIFSAFVFIDKLNTDRFSDASSFYHAADYYFVPLKYTVFPFSPEVNSPFLCRTILI